MKRKVLLGFVTLFVFLLIAVSALAETISVHYLLLRQADGTAVKFALTDYPVLTFEDGDLVVSCNGERISFGVQDLTTHEIIIEQVDKTPTAIDRVVSSEGVSPSYPQIGFGQASFSGLKEGQQIRVYTVDGKIVSTVKVAADGKAAVDLRSLPKGVYILRAPNKSYKISNQ